MRFPQALQEGILLKRYKRFLADIRTSSGQHITIHCPNTGSMKNCQTPGSRVWYTDSENTQRKYPCTWQIVEVDQKEVDQKEVNQKELDRKQLVGINTGLANKLVAEAVTNGVVDQLAGYDQMRPEVPYGKQGSRIDLLFQNDTGLVEDSCFVEIKNVSLGMGGGLGVFPDAVTTRGHKHLQELMEMQAMGARAMLFFCVQHTGIDWIQPADAIDAEYARLLRLAHDSGVEVLAYRASFDIPQNQVQLTRQLPVRL